MNMQQPTDSTLLVESSLSNPVPSPPTFPSSSNATFSGPPLSKPEGSQGGGYSIPLTPSLPTHFPLFAAGEPVQKRTHLEFSMPPDVSDNASPRKKVKKESVRVSEEVENFHSLRTLQLARASRDTLAASLRYHRLRLKELDVMRTIVTEECKQVEALLREADLRIDEIKDTLDRDGTGLPEPGPSNMFDSSGKDPCGDDNGASPSDGRLSSPSSDYSC